MTTHARGAFDVKLSPLADDKGEGASLGRMEITIADGKHSYDFEYTIDTPR